MVSSSNSSNSSKPSIPIFMVVGLCVFASIVLIYSAMVIGAIFTVVLVCMLTAFVVIARLNAKHAAKMKKARK